MRRMLEVQDKFVVVQVITERDHMQKFVSAEASLRGVDDE